MSIPDIVNTTRSICAKFPNVDEGAILIACINASVQEENTLMQVRAINGLTQAVDKVGRAQMKMAKYT
jgi:hypothetical protein